MKIKKILTLIILLTTTISCSKKEVALDTKNLTASEVYEQGLKLFENGKYLKSVSYFAKINEEFPHFEKAKKALYFEGLSYYKAQRYDDAIAVFDGYLILYPQGKNSEEAMFLKANSFYNRILEINLDQTDTQNAKIYFNELLQEFPNTHLKNSVHLKLDLIDDQFSAKELLIGKYYQRRNLYIGAINRFSNIINNYPTTVYAEEALHRLVETYLMIGVVPEAKKYAAILGHNYRSGRWYKQSYNLLKKINAN